MQGTFELIVSVKKHFFYILSCGSFEDIKYYINILQVGHVGRIGDGGGCCGSRRQGVYIPVPKTTEAAAVGHRRLAPYGIDAAAITTTTTVFGTFGRRGCPAPSASFPRCGQDKIKEECLGSSSCTQK